MRPIRFVASLTTIVGTALAVAACGGSTTSQSNNGSPSAGTPASTAATPASTAATPASTAATPVSTAAQAVTMVLKSDVEHGRLGPDKQWHDAALPADYTVHAGATVTVTAVNYDVSPHTFNAPSLGVNAQIPAGSTKAPKKTTFTFKAPSKPGSYQWFCAMPCDPWAMTHDGYMRGVVTVA